MQIWLFFFIFLIFEIVAKGSFVACESATMIGRDMMRAII